MKKPGIYISDVQSMESLNDLILASGDAMADIDQNVENFINGVQENLERQLSSIQSKLNEAESRLSDAENARSVCYASQVVDPETGMVTPSCECEESDVAAAQCEVDKWRSRYEQGQRIVGECQREIEEYKGEGGGQALIMKMSREQTPEASRQLCDCIRKLHDIFNYDVSASLNNVAGNVPEEPVLSQDGKRILDLKKHFKV